MKEQILLYFSIEENLWLVEQSISHLKYGGSDSKDLALTLAIDVSKALGQELIIHDKENRLVVRPSPEPYEIALNNQLSRSLLTD